MVSVMWPRDCVDNVFVFVFVFSVDYSKGFGGKYGVQKDRVDKVT